MSPPTATAHACVMTRTRYYTASSADGFIATTEHSLDWLLRQQIDQDDVLGHNSFIRDIGALAMGASTYAWILRHMDATGEAWAYDMPCWVFTHRALDVPTGADVRPTSAPVPQVHAELVNAAGGRDVWIVGGGDLAGQFADHGLLDEVTVCWASVTLGGGAPLLPRTLDLKLTDAGRNGDFVCARYEVVRPGA